MATLEIVRGLPASGKTTYAVTRLAAASLGTLARVNRDDLRIMVFGSPYQSQRDEFEDLVTVVQHRMIRTLLMAEVDVICDDTNLNPAHVEALSRIAWEYGQQCRIVDLRHVSVAECIGRDAGRRREFRVGPQVIYDMWARWIEPRGLDGLEIVR